MNRPYGELTGRACDLPRTLPLARATCSQSDQAVSPSAKWHASNEKFEACHRREAVTRRVTDEVPPFLMHTSRTQTGMRRRHIDQGTEKSSLSHDPNLPFSQQTGMRRRHIDQGTEKSSLSHDPNLPFSQQTGMRRWHIDQGTESPACLTTQTGLFRNKPACAGGTSTKGWKSPACLTTQTDLFHNKKPRRPRFARTAGLLHPLPESAGRTLIPSILYSQSLYRCCREHPSWRRREPRGRTGRGCAGHAGSCPWR